MKNHILFEVLLLSTGNLSWVIPVLNIWRTSKDYGSRQAKVDKKPGARCWQLLLSKSLLPKHYTQLKNGVFLPLRGRVRPEWQQLGKALGTPVAWWEVGILVITTELLVNRSLTLTPITADLTLWTTARLPIFWNLGCFISS